MRMNKAKPGPIGIDLSGNCLHAVQLETVDGAATLLTCASHMPSQRSGGDVQSRIDALLRSHHFLGRRITTVIPEKAVGIHTVQLPPMSEEASGEGVVAEICKRLNCRSEDVVIRRVQVNPGAGRGAQAEFVVFTAPRNVIEDHLRLAEKLGLELVGITALPLAMGYAFIYLGQRREESEFTFLLVHLAERSTQLLALQKGEVRFVRALPYGVHDILDAVARTTGRSSIELKEEQEVRMKRQGEQAALEGSSTPGPADPQAAAVPYEQAGEVLQSYCEEMTSCLCYYAGMSSGRGIDKMVFAGPQANDYDFCRMLANRLGLPAQIGDPLAGMRRQSEGAMAEANEGRPKPELAISVGLSVFGTLVDQGES